MITIGSFLFVPDAILQEANNPGRVFSAAADPRLFALNPSYQLPEVFYPTADQVYFDQPIPAVSFGLLPGR